MKGNAYEEILNKIANITSGEIIDILVRAGYSRQELISDFQLPEKDIAPHFCA